MSPFEVRLRLCGCPVYSRLGPSLGVLFVKSGLYLALFHEACLDGYSLLPPAASVDQSLTVLRAENAHSNIPHALTDRLFGSHRKVEGILLAVKGVLPWGLHRLLQIHKVDLNSLWKSNS